jgi:thiol-disulfide isomerase/thioredoxin
MSQNDYGSRFAIIAVIAIGAALVGAWAWQSHSTVEPLPPPATSAPVLSGGVGQPRPDFVLRDVDGVSRSITEWDGQVLLVNFWATWCPPCRSEMPRLIELQETYGDQGLQIIGVALDSPELVKAYADAIGADYPMLWGEQDAIDAAHGFGFDVIGLPISAIVDRDGTVRTIHIGEMRDEHLAELVVPLVTGEGTGEAPIAQP